MYLSNSKELYSLFILFTSYKIDSPVGCNTAIGGQGQLGCMWPQSSVDPPPNCGLVSALCSRMPFTCYQRHNPDIFLSNAINATTQISFFPFNAFNAATRFSYLHMLSTPTPGFFSSHTINVTTRVSSNLMLSAPPPGFLPLHMMPTLDGYFAPVDLEE